MVIRASLKAAALENHRILRQQSKGGRAVTGGESFMIALHRRHYIRQIATNGVWHTLTANQKYERCPVRIPVRA